jgi:hypothetical protein
MDNHRLQAGAAVTGLIITVLILLVGLYQEQGFKVGGSAPKVAQPETAANSETSPESGSPRRIVTPEGERFLKAYEAYDASDAVTVGDFERAYQDAKNAGALRFSDKLVNGKTGASVWYGALVVYPWEGYGTSSTLSPLRGGWNNCSYGGDLVPNTACFVLYKTSPNGPERVTVPPGVFYPVRFIEDGDGVLLQEFSGEGGMGTVRYGLLNLVSGTTRFIGEMIESEVEAQEFVFSNDRVTLSIKAESSRIEKTASTAIVASLVDQVTSHPIKELLRIPVNVPYTQATFFDGGIAVGLDLERVLADPAHRLFIIIGDRSYFYDESQSALLVVE